MKLTEVCSRIVITSTVLLCIGNKIADEVRKIMGPRQSVSYSPVANTFSSSHINEIPRRPVTRRKPVPLLLRFTKNCTCSDIWDRKHQTILHGQTKTLSQEDCYLKYVYLLRRMKCEMRSVKWCIAVQLMK